MIKYFLHLILILLFAFSLYCGAKYHKLEISNPGINLTFPPAPQPARIKFLYSINSFRKNNIGNYKNINLLLRPFSLYIDEPYNLYVVDQNIRNVILINLKDGIYQILDKDMNIFENPIAITGDNKKFVYVLDSKGWIDVFDPKLKYIKRLNLEGKIIRATSVAYNSVNNLLYVVDIGEHNIKVFTLDGHLIKVFGKNGSNDGEFNYPTYIWIDKTGQIYVSDTLNFRIQIFNRDGKFIKSIGSIGDTPGHFSKLKGIATDSFNNIYAVDSYFDNVQIFDKEGRILLAFGSSGNKYGEFWLPTGIYISSEDKIFIADTYNARIQVFELIK